jgi:hypothetical protein
MSIYISGDGGMSLGIQIPESIEEYVFEGAEVIFGKWLTWNG